MADYQSKFKEYQSKFLVNCTTGEYISVAGTTLLDYSEICFLFNFILRLNCSFGEFSSIKTDILVTRLTRLLIHV